jgi:hypothetical protein
VHHLYRSLCRLEFKGLAYPEARSSSASFQVASCLDVLQNLSLVSAEIRLGVCNAMLTPMSTRFARLACAAGGVEVSAFSTAKPTTTLAEVILGCGALLPHGFAKDFEILFLNLLLEPTFKTRFRDGFLCAFPALLSWLKSCDFHAPMPPLAQPIDLTAVGFGRPAYAHHKLLDAFSDCGNFLGCVFTKCFQLRTNLSQQVYSPDLSQ